MRYRRTEYAVLALAVSLSLAMSVVPAEANRVSLGETTGSVRAAAAVMYAADFVSTAATGVAMNDAGDVAGTSYPDTGCGPFCLPPLETVVWRGGQRLVLPEVPGFSGIAVRDINNKRRVAGFAGDPSTIAHAVVWKPVGDAYKAIDLGVLPGTTSSYAVGIDNQGRVVGWSTTQSFPPDGSPFMWSPSTGMIDLSAAGFPDEAPLAMSPGGTVATANWWYRLGDPASVTPMPAPPEGFAIGTDPTAINDAGDQARFLVQTSGRRLRYLYRFNHEGTWQQISAIGVITLYGMGSISADRDVTATVGGVGMIAYGPSGLAQPLVDQLSPAYKDRSITAAGPMNASEQILAQVMVGRSARLMRLVPAAACAASCIRVTALDVKSKFVQDPADPGHCEQGGEAYNRTKVKLTVTGETGAKLTGVQVGGRFLDDYWTSTPVSGTTDAKGAVQFNSRGPCGVGAVAFLVESATKASRMLDRTTGVLTGWAIPQS